MRKPSRTRNQFFLLIVDIFILFLSVPITLMCRNLTYSIDIQLILDTTLKLLPAIVLLIAALYTFEFYNVDKVFSKHERIAFLFFACVISFFFTASIFYFSALRASLPKLVLVLYCCIVFLLLSVWRCLYIISISVQPNRFRILFLGYNDVIKYLITHSKNTYLKFDTLAVLTQKAIQTTDFLVLRSLQSLKDFLTQNKIDIVVFDKTEVSSETEKFIFSILSDDIIFYELGDFYEHTLRRVPLERVSFDFIGSETNLNQKKTYIIVKRCFDFFSALLVLILCSPIMLLAAIVIKLTSKGPVFFLQERKGFHGKIFTIIKFRTMQVANNDFSVTKENDNRITPCGKFLRKMRIDELPQLINVLKGDMSLIGPRPDFVDFANNLEKNIPAYRLRFLVKPGISGWDQISGKYHSSTIYDTSKKLQYDLYYIKNFSFFLDASIVFKTIMTILRMAGR